MGKKVHLKILGVDCRKNGQSEECFNNQAACGFAGVTVTRKRYEVTCKLCRKIISDEDGIDGGMGWDSTM